MLMDVGVVAPKSSMYKASILVIMEGEQQLLLAISSKMKNEC